MPAKISLSQLPLDLEDGLRLRFAHCDDSQQLSDFHNIKDTQWTRDLKSANHPMVKASDFTLVEDIKSNKIVSSMWFQSQTWSYRDISFQVGEAFQVSTDPKHRRRGLVRNQFDIFHAWSAVQGDLVQVVSGIPWFFRQFGYEMAMNLDIGGSRRIYQTHVPFLRKDEEEIFHLRLPEGKDYTFIRRLYEQNCQRQIFRSCRSSAQWEFEFQVGAKNPKKRREWFAIENSEKEFLGYVQYDIGKRYDTTLEKITLMLNIHQLEIVPEVSYLNLIPSLLRNLWHHGQQKDDIQALNFKLGIDHPSYEVLPRNSATENNYAWYIRVPDAVAYLQHIKPALEKNLERSVAQGYNGEFKVNFFRSGLKLKISKGKIIEISDWMPLDVFEGNPRFPDLTFLQLIFGRRRFRALAEEYPDLYGDKQAATVFDCLFPPFTGNIWKVV